MLRAIATAVLALFTLSTQAVGLSTQVDTQAVGLSTQSGGGVRSDQDTPTPAPLVTVRGSIFTSRLELGATPPELRSVRHIQLLHVGSAGAPRSLQRTQEEALELGAALQRALNEGADFDALARVHSAASNAAIGSVMGTFAPGALLVDFDAFLFGADLGEVSAPISAPTGVHVLQRVELHAACLEIRLDGDSDEVRRRIAELHEVALAGADFADLARRHSQNFESAKRGGALALFERGPADRLLKGAAFRLALGEISEPMQTPLGWHLLKRVPLDGFPPELIENNWMRFRGLAVLHSENPFGIPAPDRTSAQAAELAREIEARLDAGEDFVELVRQFNDDFENGRERDGLVGWVHSRQPGVPPFMAEAFRLEVGAWIGPLATNIGWVFVRREG